MSKEGIAARQVILGVAQTADGVPLYHKVFDGNTSGVTTLRPVIEKIINHFLFKHVNAAADRKLLSTDNLADLQATKLPCGAALVFILAVPCRRYTDFVGVLSLFHCARCLDANDEVLGKAY